MFGCAKFFHTAAILWKAWGSLGTKHGENVIKTHHLERLRVSAGVHPYTLNPYLRSPLMNTSGSWRECNDWEGTCKRMRFR